MSFIWPIRSFFGGFGLSYYFEMLAVSSGIARFGSASKNHSPLLRRNIHRIEKGLTSRNRRGSFALGFIGETVDEYLSRRNELDPVEANWCKDVLNEYFQNVDQTPKIEREQTRFLASLEEVYSNPDGSGPSYKSSDASIVYSQFLSLTKQRRSVRYFSDKKVMAEDVDKAIEAGLQSPSSCNRLPYRLIRAEGYEESAKILDLPFGAAGFSHQVPYAIAVIGDFSNYFSPRDRHGPYIDGALFTMAFTLALETLGMASTIVNWPELWIQDLRAKSVLKIKKHERVLFMVALGFPDESLKIPGSGKKSVSAMSSYLDPS